MPNLLKFRGILFLQRSLGLDRAIGASTVTQLLRFATGPITMLLIIRHLTRDEQGYFYSFAGVMGIQVFLEAGFAQSISQFASKEFSDLRFNNDGYLVGKRAALSRLRSIFHKANRYYSMTAVLLTVGLAVGGYLFFSSKDSHGVPWLAPWLVGSVCAGFGFLLTPFWAILDGCNRVAEVAVYRLWSTLASFATSAVCLMLGAGIYVVAWGSVISLAFSIVYLAILWRNLIRQMLRPAGSDQISWRKEIWGFQWRIAGTWMSRYFLESGVSPLAFQLSGVVAAGQIGMTFQIVRLIGGVANTWTVVKIPGWGALAAQGKWQEINDSWILAARRNVSICTLGLSGFVLSLIVLGQIWPEAAGRFLNPSSASGFAVGWILYSVWLVAMHYTRALRKEPYTFLHLAVGIAFLVACLLLSDRMGDATIPWVFAAVHLPAAIIAWRILHHIRAATPQSA